MLTREATVVSASARGVRRERRGASNGSPPINGHARSPQHASSALLASTILGHADPKASASEPTLAHRFEPSGFTERRSRMKQPSLGGGHRNSQYIRRFSHGPLL